MGPTERGLLSLIEIVREGGYSPIEGRPVPIERIYDMNTISFEQFELLKAELEAEEKKRKNGRAIEDMETDADFLRDRMLSAGVPKSMSSCAIDSTMTANLKDGAWLYVHGQSSEMVNTKACASLKGWLNGERFGLAKFERNTSMLARLRDEGASAVNEYAAIGMLLIAGIGYEAFGDVELGLLHDVLDRRRGNGMPVIFSSRHSPPELAGRLGSYGNEESAWRVVEIIQAQSIVLPV